MQEARDGSIYADQKTVDLSKPLVFQVVLPLSPIPAGSETVSVELSTILEFFKS